MAKKENGKPGHAARHHGIMDVLLEISEAVNRTQNLTDLYRAIHRSLGKIINVDNFFIAIHHPERDAISFPYYVDAHDTNIHEIEQFSRTASLTGKVIQANKPLLFREKEIRRLARAVRKTPIGTLSRIWLGAPLTIGSRVTGAVAVQSYQSETCYDTGDLDILNLVARHIALALERKEFSDALQNQGEILGKILETSPVGIALVENRTFQWVNQEMVTLFGYQSKKDFTHRSARIIYPSDDAFKSAEKILYQQLSVSRRQEADLTFIRQDGTTFPGHVKLSSADIKDPAASVIATFSDLTQRHRAEKERVEKERLQGVLEMAGAVCHELNQPLQSLLAHSELIAMDQPPDSPVVKDLKTIQDNVSRISRITRRLASITKYKTVQYPGNLKIVDIWESSDIP